MLRNFLLGLYGRLFVCALLLTWSAAAAQPERQVPEAVRTVRVADGQDVSAAIAAAARTSAILYLPPGEYPVLHPISLPSGTVLSGAGPRTVLKTAADSEGIGLFELSDVSRVTVRSLVIDQSEGRGRKMDGIRGTNLQHFVFEDLELRAAPSRAINLWGKCAHGTIRRCKVLGSGDRGIVLGGASHCIVENCVVQNCGSHGIWALSNAEFITIRNNEVSDNRGQGIELFKGCTGCSVAFNRVRGNALGIHCFTVTRTLLLGNLVEHNRSNGIDCNNCQQMRILGNHVEFSGSKRTPQNKVEGSGILLFRSRDSIANGNVSINNDQGHSLRSGIQLMDEGDDEFLCARNVVTGNVCFDDQEKPTQEYGMRIGRPQSKCPDNLVVANSLGRHPRGPFGGNRRGGILSANNWTGTFPEPVSASPTLPVVERLPQPARRWRGRILLLQKAESDIPYLCLRRNGKLLWQELAPETLRLP